MLLLLLFHAHMTLSTQRAQCNCRDHFYGFSIKGTLKTYKLAFFSHQNQAGPTLKSFSSISAQI
jgi:hypothetical protein